MAMGRVSKTCEDTSLIGRTASTPVPARAASTPVTPGELSRMLSIDSSSSKPVTFARTAYQAMEGVSSDADQFLALIEKSEDQFLSLMDDDRALSVSQADRRDLHLDTCLRSDTVLGYGYSQRDQLVKRASERDTQKVAINEGQTGSVFALELDGEKVAVFKPEAGESFQRHGFQPGSGAVREEAVYIVDRLCTSEAGVPVTTLGEITVAGQSLRGAVQAFHNDVAGFCDDFGMPRSPVEAAKVVTRECAEHLALLDIRVFNTDRHGANLLFLGQRSPYKLGPIDHGCCLPPWWALGEAGFSAWETWPQLQGNPSEEARASTRKAHHHLPNLCRMLRDRGLDFDAIVTLRLCTTFAYVGVGELGLPIAKLADLMKRDDFSELSWMEQELFDCAVDLGVKLTLQRNDRGDQELVLEDGDGLDESWANRFVDTLEQRFRSKLLNACSAGDDDDDDSNTLERTSARQY